MNIKIKRECNCTKKLNYVFKDSYLDKEQLESEATFFLKKLNNICCETHSFTLQKEDDNIVINSKLNLDKAF